MKNTGFFGKTCAAALAGLLCVFALAGCGFDDDSGGGDTDDDSDTGGGTKRIAVTFVSAPYIDFAADDINTSARISLGFDRDPGLGASDVTAEWENGDAIAVSSLDLDPDGGAYTLTLDEITASGTVTVSVAKDGYAFAPESRTVQVVYLNDPYNASIKEKFGITKTGTDGVKAAFNALHGFIEGDGLDALPDVIQLGNWIDLEGGLTVAGYEGQGEIDNAVNRTVVSDLYPFSYQGSTLRLIVVGINSFQSGKGSGGQYTITANDGTPHVVFQFQNVPVNRRMNQTNTNDGGYAGSEMRKYLVPVGGDKSSGRFLAGLKNAGVPQEVLWAPKRYVSKGYNDNPDGIDTDEIIDLLWLPTEWEMFENGTVNRGRKPYSANGETAENQACLEYYNSDKDLSRRYKHYESALSWYWESSPYAAAASGFCVVSGRSGIYYGAVGVGGCVPAFCVR
jgi:hypothetical protein